MSATEDDLQWLRNVNTRPGPGAGRSIDPSKPGPGPQDVQASAITAMADAMMAEDQQFQRKPYYIALAAVAYDALAQSDAEPVAWQWRVPGKDWPELSCGKDRAEYMRERGAEIRPIFAAPPASAGLIEAAEWHEEQAFEWAEIMIKCRPDRVDECKAKQELHFYCARELRSRAADRSGK